MKLSLGIVGLPNVGKSTLFNALTKNQVAAQNYPFCTIDPNIGVVAVYDQRLDQIAKIEEPEEVKPAVIEFVDIAGLIAGAHKGEGLGNKFLASIREVDAIIHVVRVFEDDNVIHVENKVSPRDDIETINTELILKDIETVEKSIEKVEKMAKASSENKLIHDFLLSLLSHLGKNRLAKDFLYDIENEEIIGKYRRQLSLLTDKPVVILLNTSEVIDGETLDDIGLGDECNENVIQIDIKTESELLEIDESERAEYMEQLGIQMSGIEKLTQISYKILGLISYFTAGPKEVRAWTIKRGENIRDAAAAIHNDFRDKFIAAEVVSYHAYIEHGGWDKAKAVGKVRLEGKEYTVSDGDIVLFKHGA